MSRHHRSFSLSVVLLMVLGALLAACGTAQQQATVGTGATKVATVVNSIGGTAAPTQGGEAGATPTVAEAEGTSAPAETVGPAETGTAPGEGTAGPEATGGPVGGTTSACAKTGDTSKGALLVYSSLPLTGPSKVQTDSVVNGMKLALEDHQGAAGGYKVNYQALDDATAAAAKWTPEQESANATKAVQDGVSVYLGTFNSGAASVSIPIMNQAGIPMISPANTDVNLTKKGADPKLLASLYTKGPRNYFRVVPNDTVQGPADANWAKELGAKKVYVLHDQETYGLGVARLFEQRAKEIGLEVAGFEGIDPKAGSYASVMEKAVNSDADLVYFGGLVETGGPQLLKDLRDIVEDPEEVKFLGPDGILESSFVSGAGRDVAEGAYGTVAARPAEKATGSGAEFYKKYKERYNSAPEPYAIFGYDAMGVALHAIDKSCSKNPKDILEALKSLGEHDGALGTFSFDKDGDTTLEFMNAYKVQNGAWKWVKELSAK